MTGAIASFSSGKTAPVNIIGSDPPDFVAGPKPEKIEKGNIYDLVQDNAISADFFDASTFANPTDIGTELEINGKKAFIKAPDKGCPWIRRIILLHNSFQSKVLRKFS